MGAGAPRGALGARAPRAAARAPAARGAARRPAGRDRCWCSCSALGLDRVRATPRSRARPAKAARVAVERELAYLKGRRRRRRLRRGARAAEQRALHGLGGDRARRGGGTRRRCAATAIGARRAARRSREPARRGRSRRTILALHACGASRALAARRRSGQAGARLPRRGRLLLAPLEPHRLRDPRAARRGLRAASAPIADAAHWLARQQEGDGGFGFAARGAAAHRRHRGGDAGTRGAGRATVRPGPRRQGVPAPLAEPRRRLPEQRGGPSDAQSTAWAVQAFAAAGVAPRRSRARAAASPLAYLETLLAPDGSVRYSRIGAQTPVWVTAQALTGLEQRPLPVAAALFPVSRPANRLFYACGMSHRQ